VAVIDRDSGFVVVLQKRLDRLEWKHRVLTSMVSPDQVASMRLHAVIVDLSVLGFQAWEWLEQVRRAVPELSIVVCTGSSTVAQRVRGLELGADDWITKPCHPAEVIARVRGVVARRQQGAGATAAEPISTGEIEIRLDRFQAYVDGTSLDLTKREFELIHLLASAEGQVLEREEIFSRVWGFTMGPGDRTVDVFVRKLRLKLSEASPDWRYIHTHFGIGYRFAPESLDIQESA
jgi:DNA-binding response OmpR family regulator